MLKKKLLFKEDKSQMNRMKQNNERINKCSESLEDSKRTRGRQLNNKCNGVSQNNLLNTIKYQQIVSTENKTVSNIKIVQNKSKNKIYINKIEKLNGYNSKNYRADSFEIEEDCQSSDSVCSIRNNKKRELLEDNSELPENLKYSYQVESLDNSQEAMENYEVCDEFALTYGDNLTNEVERILIDIYNNHVYINSRKKIDISKYEKHVKIFLICIKNF